MHYIIVVMHSDLIVADFVRSKYSSDMKGLKLYHYKHYNNFDNLHSNFSERNRVNLLGVSLVIGVESDKQHF